MVGVARTLIPTGGRINVQVGVAEKLPFADASFDLVFSTMTFHHWPDQVGAASEVGRVLAPGGRWVLADFVAVGLMRPVRKLLRMHHFPSRQELDQILGSAGLRAVAGHRVPQLGGQVAVLAIARSGG
jgi:ubiquinone/menaquinone biosynthesis C-methylase UbiE